LHESQDEALDDKDALYAVFEDLIKGIDFSFKQGDVVSGTVFEIDQKGAYLDIGAKSAAFCPTAEVSLCKIGRVCCWVHCRVSTLRVETAS
jgi:S1 RNA binding domain